MYAQGGSRIQKLITNSAHAPQRQYANNSWQSIFQTEDPSEAERIVSAVPGFDGLLWKNGGEELCYSYRLPAFVQVCLDLDLC